MDYKNELIKKEQNLNYKINEIGRSKFNSYAITDGIINYDNYLKAKFKILWIMREPRVDEDDKERRNKSWDLAKDMYNNIGFGSIINNCSTRRELIINHMILSEITPEEAINCTLKNTSHEKKKIAELDFKSTSVINVRKFPGNVTHNEQELLRAFNFSKELLVEQIEFLKPDIIICGNTLQLY